MNCQKCKSDRIVSLYGKCSDMCSVEIKGFQQDGYVPSDLNIGGGDDIQFNYCIECGQIQGEFPLKLPAIEEDQIDAHIVEKQNEEARERNNQTDKQLMNQDGTFNVDDFVFDSDTPEGMAKMKKEIPGLGTTTIEEYSKATRDTDE